MKVPKVKFYFKRVKNSKTGFCRLLKKSVKYLKNGSNDLANFLSKESFNLLLSISTTFRRILLYVFGEFVFKDEKEIAKIGFLKFRLNFER